MSDAVRVEKVKWDGSVSATVAATRVEAAHDAVAWFVRAGAVREHPKSGEAETVATDELWVAVPGQWWVLVGHAGPDHTIEEYILNAAAPFEPPASDTITWIDLDLDFEVHGNEIELEDELQFHEHARSMAYPDEVVRGAWSGIASMAPRYTTGEWPFDGWMDEQLKVRATG